MIRLNTVIKAVAKSDESGELKIKGKASTPATDRAKDIILADAWAKGGIDNYRKNPILLFNHNYDEPIGKVTEVTLTDQGLEVEGVVFPGSKAYPLIENGVLRTFSVGFLIKDADYNKATDGLIIKDVELLEISVVSVPCNQEAVFELSKTFSDAEFENLKKQFGKTEEGVAQTPSNKKMDENEVNELIAKSVADALSSYDAKKAEEAEQARKAAEAAEAQEKAISATVTKTVAEKVEEAVKSAMESANPSEELSKTVTELKDTVKGYEEEIKTLKASREGFFPDRGSNKSWIENGEVMDNAVEAFILAKALGKPFEETSKGQEVLKAVNALSSITVASDKFETEVITTIHRDIEQELVIKPLFREVPMSSASQVLTIAPDTGYATHQTTGSSLPGTKPNGLLNNKDGTQPYALSEIALRTDKLVSKAYLANDTEEDAILPLLSLIRDGMTRQHAKSVDQMILTAGIVGSTYPNMTSKGLLKYAATNGRTSVGPAEGSALTGAHLLAARSKMGKYGLKPNDLVYIVNTTGYYELLKDEAFYDNYQVGTGTKVTGEVGRMFGTRVIVSAEMDGTATEDDVVGMVLNTRNFVVPRLRGYTFESEYSVDGQHLLMATTQRLGFSEIIPNAMSVVAIAYGEAPSNP